MALLRYLKHTRTLPTANETGISESTTKEANAAVSRVLAGSESGTVQPGPSGSRKRKAYTSFSEEHRAAIGQHAAEHRNAAAVQQFKTNFEGGLGESTVRLFNKKYLFELKKARKKLLQHSKICKAV